MLPLKFGPTALVMAPEARMIPESIPIFEPVPSNDPQAPPGQFRVTLEIVTPPPTRLSASSSAVDTVPTTSWARMDVVTNAKKRRKGNTRVEIFIIVKGGYLDSKVKYTNYLNKPETVIIHNQK